MRAPLAYVATRSRRPPRSAHTDWPWALPRRSQHATSIAERASVKMPPGPEPPAARRSFAAIASTWVGSSPTTSPARASTAALSAGVSAAPKNVRPRPTRPWSVPSSRVTNSRVSVGAGRPTTSGLSAGVRSTRVVTWVIFIGRLLQARWLLRLPRFTRRFMRCLNDGGGTRRGRLDARLARDARAHAVRRRLDGLALLGRGPAARAAPRGQRLVDPLDPEHPDARPTLPRARPGHAGFRRVGRAARAAHGRRPRRPDHRRTRRRPPVAGGARHRRVFH